jgi:hypothetical protein
MRSRTQQPLNLICTVLPSKTADSDAVIAPTAAAIGRRIADEALPETSLHMEGLEIVTAAATVSLQVSVEIIVLSISGPADAHVCQG